ncbi:hypothetical protein HHI36_010846 [Cryptolaemus montrouzieri]|uniref:Uncharacterized protein n=1 Tax=Cryptolaemus montrouzieri TaxID=559131 RepID=A0ABD2MK28_9CUCU
MQVIYCSRDYTEFKEPSLLFLGEKRTKCASQNFFHFARMNKIKFILKHVNKNFTASPAIFIANISFNKMLPPISFGEQPKLSQLLRNYSGTLIAIFILK